MAELRTDDAVRRLRAVWLGPDHFRLPVDWTYVEWAAVLGLTVTLTPLIGLAVFALLGDGFASIFAGLLFGGLGAYYLRGLATRLVDPDRSVRYWRTVVAGELRLPRLHRHTSRWRPVVGGFAVFVVARFGVAVFGGRLPVWLLVTGVPVWLVATPCLRPSPPAVRRRPGARARRAHRRTPAAAAASATGAAVRRWAVAWPLPGPSDSPADKGLPVMKLPRLLLPVVVAGAR